MNLATPESIIAGTYALKIVGVVVLVIVAWLGGSHLRRASRLGMQRARVDETLAKFFSNAIRWVILVAAGISMLEIFGVQATSFAAMLAAASLALGLAFQGTLANFAAGVMLLIFRPFKVGDMVKIAGHMGRIDEIDLFTTMMDTGDLRRIIIPNNAVNSSVIENMSHHVKRRLDIDVPLPLTLDPDMIRSTLIVQMAKVSGLLAEPAPTVILANITVDKQEWQTQAWVLAQFYAERREQMLVAIHAAMKQLLPPQLPPPPP